VEVGGGGMWVFVVVNVEYIYFVLPCQDQRVGRSVVAPCVLSNPGVVGVDGLDLALLAAKVGHQPTEDQSDQPNVGDEEAGLILFPGPASLGQFLGVHLLQGGTEEVGRQ